MFWLQDAQSTVLKDDSIPTAFDMSSQPQNGQAKRTKPTVGQINQKCSGIPIRDANP